MQKALLLLGLSAGSVFAQFEQSATNGFFIGGGLGYASQGSDSESSLQGEMLWNIEIGKEFATNQYFNNLLSLEVLGSNYDAPYLESISVGALLNYQAKLKVNKYFSLFAGAGIGVINTTLDVFGFDLYNGGRIRLGDATESVLAYQFKAGVEVKPIERLGIYAQYRYLSGEDFEDLDFTAIEDHFGEVGVKFYF